MLPEIKLTEKAAKVFVESCKLENHELSEVYLRVEAVPGGCSGYKYGLELNYQADIQDSDVQFESHGITVVVDKVKLTELLGPLSIDYTSDNLIEEGFVFVQQSGRQCGCGESFTPYQEDQNKKLGW